MNAMPSLAPRMSCTWISPEACSRGRSTWVTSPVTTTWETNPMRVRNICICSGLVFCASSRMMKESLSVRPRMKASGATSSVPRSMYVFSLVHGVEDGVHRRGPDLLPGLHELDELVDDRARLRDVDVVPRDREPVPAQENRAFQAVAESAEDAVADRGELGGDVVGD